MELNYTVHYTALPSRAIYNLVGPYDFRDDEDRKALGHSQIQQQQQFYDSLEQSIQAEGFLNPIVVIAGKVFDMEWPTLPLFAQREKLVCPQYGGSRLWVGQKLGLAVPCIVCDYSKNFSSAVELKTTVDIKRKFKDSIRLTVAPHYVEIIKEMNDD